MAKRKKKADEPVDPNAFMADMVAAAEKKFGTDHMYVAAEHTQRLIGLPLPSLALEYMLCSNVLYMGSAYGIAGPPASFKSSLGLEFARMVCEAGGTTALAETEGGKISPDIVKSVLGQFSNRMLMRLAGSVEEAQAFLTLMITWFQGAEGSKTRPYGLFLDSLFGASGKEKKKKIVEDGFAGRSFPLEALLWTQWLQTWAPKLVGWPMILVYVNHQKRDIDSKYKSSFRHPGGDAQEFYATVYMHVKKIKVNEGVEQRIAQLEIRTVKHSFAPEGRKINVPFVTDKTASPPRLFFDWGHATADLLTDKKKCPNIADILHVTTSSDTMTGLTRTFSCKQLGLKAVSGGVLGLAVHQADGIMAELRKALGIREHEVWAGCMPAAVSEEKALAEGQHAETAAPEDAGELSDL